MAGGEGRQRERSRDRSRSREKGGEVSKRGRDKNPYPKARRVSRERDDTNRDSDESQENEQVKEAEKELKRAQEKLAREKKKSQKQRRLKRTNSNETETRIFTANEIAQQMNELERLAEERLQEKES